MKICIAQIKAVKGDINQNIASHIKFVERAADLHASAIFFPELSLTGYEAELAKALATTAADIRFKIFQQICMPMLVEVGTPAPIVIDFALHIC